MGRRTCAYSSRRALITASRQRLAGAVHAELTRLYWTAGQRLASEVLGGERAGYGARLLDPLGQQLAQESGRGFESRNLRRMVKFAEAFPEVEIVSTLSTPLSWSRLVAIVALKTPEARAFDAQHAVQDGWRVRELNRQIGRKAFERTEIAAARSPALAASPALIFKDPYFLDVLGLHQGHDEADLKAALLRQLEAFILALARGFAFVERQKRMVIDGEDFYFDLLFFHRRLRRPVAIELKLGRFKAAHKGQMELYLKWLDKQHERQAGEEAPIGLILPGRRQPARTWPGSNFEISGSRKLPSTPPDLRPSARALHEAIHRRVLPSAREAGTCLRQFFDTRWRGSVR
ncbi:hypothetical protein VAPA_1c47160 [Variovorax paradoxus B4]|uniref:DUF1016 domain-containing protein n=1 Tax=Variovorax paradoxus B4 TaxID=1246301 RepID=T1XGU0_VARPD|nr:PDDEXK nuclease domain-containing protein [Variovorax paradoxus]AGU51783.1 hypothetical protein VAPA_1c47160 [Variovorax paradoxus B4]